MAAPNIVNVSGIYGRTAVQSITTSLTDIVANSAASNKVFKINSLIIANINGANTADVTAEVLRGGVSYRLAFTVAVPADSTLVLISKDTSIYLEEGDSLRLSASSSSFLQAVCSFEEIN